MAKSLVKLTKFNVYYVQRCHYARLKKKPLNTDMDTQMQSSMNLNEFKESLQYRKLILKDKNTKSPITNEFEGWYGVFNRCKFLLQLNTDSIVYVMGKHNDSLIGFGLISLCLGCYYHTYIPYSIVCSWTVIRLFTTVIPLLPHLLYKPYANTLINNIPSLIDLKFSKEFPDPNIQGSREYMIYHQQKSEKEVDILLQKRLFKIKELRTKLSVQYGFSYNISENIYLIFMYPLFGYIFYIVGMNDDAFYWLFNDSESYLSILKNYMYFPIFMKSYIATAWFLRLIAPC